MPRKTCSIRTTSSAEYSASMRPRPDAAENEQEEETTLLDALLQ